MRYILHPGRARQPHITRAPDNKAKNANLLKTGNNTVMDFPFDSTWFMYFKIEGLCVSGWG